MGHAIRLGLLPVIMITGLAFAMNARLGIAALALTTFPLLFAHAPRLGIWLVIFCIPFDRLLLFAPGMGLSVTKVFIAITAAVYLAKFVLTRDGRPLRSLVATDTSLLVLAYMLASILSLMNARDMDAAVSVMIRRTSVIVLYFLVLNIIDSRKLLNGAIDALLLGSVSICLVGVYEFVAGDAVLEEAVHGTELLIRGDGSQRIQGGAGNSNLHGAILAMMLPLLLVRLLSAPTRLLKLMLTGLLGLYALNIFATNARNGLVGMILGVGIVFALGHIRHKFAKAILTGTALVCGLLALTALDSQRVSTDRYTGESGGKTIEYRIGWMKMGWEMGLKNPIIGQGPGSFVAQYHRYRRVAPGMVTVTRSLQHNGLLQAWGETGILGLATFCLLLLSVAWHLYRFVRSPACPEELHWLGVGLLAAFVVYVFTLGVVPALEHEVGWLIMALSMALLQIAQQDEYRPLPAPSGGTS